MFRMVCALLAVLTGTAVAAGAYDTARLKVSFDVVESQRTPSKDEVQNALSSLMRRKSFSSFRYLAGGDFTLPPYTDEKFTIRQGETDMIVSLAWKPVVVKGFTAIKVRYRASLSYPLQANFAVLEKTADLVLGKTTFISDADTAQGAQDTRPLWVVLKVELAEPSFAFPLLGSIGARLQIRGGYPYIVEVLSASPAEQAGLARGDEIQEIDGISTLGMTIDEASKLIRGDPSTTVTLKIFRPDTKVHGEKKVLRSLVE